MKMFKGLRFFVAAMLVLLVVLAQACQPGHDDTAATQVVAQRQAERGQAAASQSISSQLDASSGLPVIALAELPPEARATLRDIKQGGPFAYDRDGVVFGNREGILPKRPRAYYHEYTVKTPGVRTRGARRIVSGTAAEFYYTADHYQSFKSIRE